MHKREAERYFEGFEGARAILDAVLDGEQPGRVLEGRQGAVIAHHEGWVFLGGVPEEQLATQVKQLIRPNSGGRVYCVPVSDSWETGLAERALMCAPRSYLKRVNLQPPSLGLPPNFVLQELNPDNLSEALKLYNVERAVAAWGGPAEFLDRSFGYVVLEERRSCVASAAVAYAIARGRVEVSIATVGQFKGQGLAKCASSALIGECDRRELQADWNCFSDSAVSIAIARKLGFERRVEYRTLIGRQE